MFLKQSTEDLDNTSAAEVIIRQVTICSQKERMDNLFIQ